ncbi:uncharacterized protein LOC121642771 [Melanotaenia boesemani]|uniref:uncharacterized protein LOC121642771 n=1 Tax=Melanotaenia boesemani TaxID=1250792 RepID=UPI001C03BFAE|nr:uncharacterized protein LOC121642771 [Melanotaenia boesemani]
MMVLWVTLLILHQGYAVIPVMPVQLGGSASFTCDLPGTKMSRREVYWYKQSQGDTLKLIVKVTRLQQKPSTSKFAPEFSDSGIKVQDETTFIRLTIPRTTQEDEGIYHCAIMDWASDIRWSGTYLMVKGNTAKTLNYRVVQQLTASDPGNPETLQCSVLSDSDDWTCPEDLKLLWFRSGSDNSHPQIIYTDGNRPDDCEKRSDAQRSCNYNFSRKVTSSDDGMYYCAVATCGKIVFGNGTVLGKEQRKGSEYFFLVITGSCLVISIIINIVFICYRTPRPACEQFEDN